MKIRKKLSIILVIITILLNLTNIVFADYIAPEPIRDSIIITDDYIAPEPIRDSIVVPNDYIAPEPIRD